MVRIANIVGARPQFIKCASVSRAIRNYKEIEEIIIHTGQHYDSNMSEIFFSELDIPEPDINLGIGSGSHAVQTASMLTSLEESLLNIKPDWVVVYGDTNSTIAAGIAASKMNLKIAHVEAGLRSFNRNMPEEINRIVTDHLADLLFAPTRTAMDLLEKEGLGKSSVLSGDVMYDSVLYSILLAEKKYDRKDIIPFDDYYLATVHRQENTDHPERLEKIFKALSGVDLPVILPVHPRLKGFIKEMELGENIKLIDPVGYLQMLILINGARKILTDSGGLQKEAYFLKKQCITLRDETEWTETLENSWNILAGVEPESIMDGISRQPEGSQGDYFGDGHASEKILDSLLTSRS